jgi:hypothetical protein
MSKIEIQSLPLVLLSGTGYLLATIFLVFVAPVTPAEAFGHAVRNPEVTVWCSLVAAQVALWSGAALPILERLRKYRGYVQQRRWELLLSAVILLLLFGLFLWSHRLVSADLRFLVYYQKIKVMIITPIGLIFLLLALLGMHLVELALKNLRTKKSSAYDSIPQYLEYKDDLQWFLLISGLIVGGATLSTGALSRALAVLNADYTFNASLVILNGAFGSGVISLIYIPAYLEMRRAGMKLCNVFLEMPHSSAKDLISWHEDRMKLENLLGLKGDVLDSLKAGLAILSPLAGSAFAVLLGK